MKNINNVLGIETSCDDSAVAIYHAERGIIAHALNSQIETHAKFGGVVPELASRDHIRHLMPLIQNVLSTADLGISDIGGIAYTAGPGLIGALLVGTSLARGLGYACNIPTIGIHHLEGHLLAPMLEPQQPKFPFVALLVSGGHTLLVQVNKLGNYQILGDTLDDAVGEAFDKTAKLLGLPYPGGPAIEKLAKNGNPKRFKLARPMLNRPGLDFSFSGLKTQVMTEWQASPQDEDAQIDMAACFQQAAVDTLVVKCMRAMKQTGLKQLVVAGGVSANELLRASLNEVAASAKFSVFYPRHEYCTDNGAMIAFAGYYRLQAGFRDRAGINARARWPLDELSRDKA